MDVNFMTPISAWFRRSYSYCDGWSHAYRDDSTAGSIGFILACVIFYRWRCSVCLALALLLLLLPPDSQVHFPDSCPCEIIMYLFEGLCASQDKPGPLSYQDWG